MLPEGPPPPRVLVAPKSRANSWEDISDLMAGLGFPLDDWQDQVFEAAMGERSGGRWAAKYVGVSAPRQNGKSQLIVARALAGVLLFGEKTIIISAHDTDTAREVWRRLLDVVEANPSVEARVTGRMDAINREFLAFGRGEDRQVVKLKARRSSGVRGFSCDCLLLDEAQILGKAAWGSINPTVSARPNPQIWLFGTPPTDDDDPFAFSRVRDSGMSKRARYCWVEWSATADDDIDAPTVWAAANPAFGIRITAEACADDRAAMDDDQFRRERLGMWDASIHEGSVIPSASWKRQADSESRAADRFSLGIEIGPDLQWCSISAAGRRGDGLWHVALAHDQHTEGKGVEWLWPRLDALLAAREFRAVVVDVAGPIKTMIEQRGVGKSARYWLKRPDGTRGIQVHALTVNELGVGCTSLLSGVVTGEVYHVGQPQLSVAALSAGKRALGDTGMWVWNRRSAQSDITPIQSATYALIGAQSDKPTGPRKPGTSARGSRSSRGRAGAIVA